MDGKTYQRLRMAMGLSQRELADKLEVSTNYIAMMESGKKPVPETQSSKIIKLIMECAKSNDPVFELFREIMTEPSE